MPLGKSTAIAFKQYESIHSKIEEFFKFCQLVELEPRSRTRCGLSDMAVTKLDVTDAQSIDELMQNAPLTPPVEDAVLCFSAKINPKFRAAMSRFQTHVITPLFGADTVELSRKKWNEIMKIFGAYKAWINTEPTGLEHLQESSLLDYLEGTTVEELRKLIENDKSVADEIAAIEDVEKLLLYQIHLLDFSRNYISLSDLFEPEGPSMIQAGRLVMDGRNFDLCVNTYDYKIHMPIAVKSNICVLYLEISRIYKQETETRQVAVAVTSGSIAALYVGRMGVFFTPDGKEWQAKTLAVIANPVSLGEALKMPFVKLKEFASNQVNKFTGARYQSLEKGVGAGLNDAEKSFTTKEKKPEQTSGFKELFVGGSIALAALGSAFAFITQKLTSVKFTSILAVVGGLLALIAVPITISAILKLRRRNIGTFLQAGGWSLNVPLRLSTRVGMLFTNTPSLPDNASRCHLDLTRMLLKKLKIEKTFGFRKFVDILVLVALIAVGVTIIYINYFKT